MASDFFSNKSGMLDNMKNGIERDRTTEVYNAFVSNLDEVKVDKKRNSLTVYEDAVNSSREVIDMKPYFRASNKAKKKNNGGWYMVIPIRRYASRKMKDQARGMSKRLYNDLSRAQGNSNTVSDYLYDNRTNVSSIPELNYTPKSNNITKKKNTRGRGSIYISFRTVSDKSPVNSWILNRDKAEEGNLSEEINQIINQVRRMQQNN